MLRYVLIVAVILISLGGFMAEASQEKLDLRYHWLWGWQFHQDGQWHNVGLFASELRRALRDVGKAAEVIDQINIISLGARLVSIAGAGITLTSVRCMSDTLTLPECPAGAPSWQGATLAGASHVGGQIAQGTYFARAIRLYNRAYASNAYWPTSGWRTSTPEAQGMDSEMLADMMKTIQDQNYSIDSVSVVRNGYMVVDATVHPFRPGSRHNIYSCTKSVISALLGIALDKGYIKSVRQPVLDFFPGRTVANLDGNKEAMTLEHLLTMTTGLKCQDSYLYRWRGLDQMRRSDDWVQYVLDLPMAEAPGTRFEYCNGASFLLSAIIQETTGMNSLAFAEEYLFGPLGITDVEWFSNPQGITIGWSDLHMRPHDMAKIGYLYLNEGRWDGQQVMPAGWVRASTRKHISATLQDAYGYQWWVADNGVYMALGYAGQFIFVVPRKELVVVFASQLPERDFYVPQQLLNGFVIPAAKSSTSLPENPEGTALLESLVEALSNS